MSPILWRMSLVLESKSAISAEDLESSGQQLVSAAGYLWWQFYEAHHCVLPATLRDAGIGLLTRSDKMRRRAATKEDALFYSEVRDVLSQILSTIESGDYAEQLARIRATKESP